jgi:hypothetical protein
VVGEEGVDIRGLQTGWRVRGLLILIIWVILVLYGGFMLLNVLEADSRISSKNCYSSRHSQ